jgi:hypothetical protein
VATARPPASPAGQSPAGLRADVGSILAWVLVGCAAGAVAGFLVGGVGGRLAMLLLRETSGERVLGVTSDDGFEIGVVSADTFQLLLAMTMLGGLNGILYAVVRPAIPRRLRLPLWVGFAALVGGAGIVHEDGVDFTLISPLSLAIALFVLLPGAAAALVVVLVERWSDGAAWQSRRRIRLLLAASLASTFALLLAALVTAGALLVRRLGIRSQLLAASRVLVPAGLLVVGLVAGFDLVAESSRILRA